MGRDKHRKQPKYVDDSSSDAASASTFDSKTTDSTVDSKSSKGSRGSRFGRALKKSGGLAKRSAVTVGTLGMLSDLPTRTSKGGGGGKGSGERPSDVVATTKDRRGGGRRGGGTSGAAADALAQRSPGRDPRLRGGHPSASSLLSADSKESRGSGRSSSAASSSALARNLAAKKKKKQGGGGGKFGWGRKKGGGGVDDDDEVVPRRLETIPSVPAGLHSSIGPHDAARIRKAHLQKSASASPGNDGSKGPKSTDDDGGVSHFSAGGTSSGADYAKVSKTKYSLGLVYLKTKKYARARDNFDKAYQARLSMLGLGPDADHPSLAEIHEQYGLIAEEEGDLEKARHHYGAALKMIRDYEPTDREKELDAAIKNATAEAKRKGVPDHLHQSMLEEIGLKGEGVADTADMERRIVKARERLPPPPSPPPTSQAGGSEGTAKAAGGLGVAGTAKWLEKTAGAAKDAGGTVAGAAAATTSAVAGGAGAAAAKPQTIKWRDESSGGGVGPLTAVAGGSVRGLSDDGDAAAEDDDTYHSLSGPVASSDGQRERTSPTVDQQGSYSSLEDSTEIDWKVNQDLRAAYESAAKWSLAEKQEKKRMAVAASDDGAGPGTSGRPALAKQTATRETGRLDTSRDMPERDSSKAHRRDVILPSEDDKIKAKNLDRNVVGGPSKAAQILGEEVDAASAAGSRMEDEDPEIGFKRGEDFYAKGDYVKAKSWFVRSLKRRQLADGEDSLEVALTREKIGDCEAKLLNEKNAHRNYQIALRAIRPKLGNSTEEVARILNSSGDLYASSGDFDLALLCYDESFEVRSDILPETDPELLQSAWNLVTTKEAIGNVAMEDDKSEDALENFEDALSILRTSCVNDSDRQEESVLKEAKHLILLGYLRSEMEDFRKSQQMLQEAQQMVEDTEGVFQMPKYEKEMNQALYAIYRLKAFINEKSGKYNKAMECYVKVTPIVRKQKASENLAHIMTRVAFLHAKNKEQDEAISCFEGALKLLKLSGSTVDYDEYTTALDMITSLLVKKNNFERAEKFLEERAAITRQFKGGVNNSIAVTYDRIASLLNKLGSHSRAIPYHLRALNVRKELYGPDEDHPEIVATLRSLAAAYHASGEYILALDHYKELLRVVDPAERPGLLNAIGLISSQHGMHEQAVDCFDRSLRYQKKEKSTKGQQPTDTEVSTLINLGNTYALMKRYDTAISWYEKALNACKGADSPLTEHEVRTLNNIGLLYYEQELYDETIDCFQEVLGRLDATDDVMKATVLKNIGNANFKLGRHNEAIKYYEKCLKVEQECTDLDVSERVGMLSNIGSSYLQMRKFDKAVHYLELAIKEYGPQYDDEGSVTGGRHDLEVAHLWEKIGRVHLRKKDCITAMKYHERALNQMKEILDESHPTVLRTSHGIGLILARDGQFEEALDILKEVHRATMSCPETNDRNFEEAKLLLDMAGLHYHLSEFRRAEALCRKSMTLLKSLGLPEDHVYLKQCKRWMSKINNVQES